MFRFLLFFEEYTREKYNVAYSYWYTAFSDRVEPATFRTFLWCNSNVSPGSGPTDLLPHSLPFHLYSQQVTSPILVVGNSCRKKNLEPCACYEFRVRAASAWGWSVHCDPVMVVTLSTAAVSKEEGGNASASPRQKAREETRIPSLCHKAEINFVYTELVYDTYESHSPMLFCCFFSMFCFRFFFFIYMVYY